MLGRCWQALLHPASMSVLQQLYRLAVHKGMAVAQLSQHLAGSRQCRSFDTEVSKQQMKVCMSSET